MAANKRLGPVSSTRLVIVSVVDAAERGEPVHQARLARELGLHPSTVADAIASAVAQGLLVRIGRGRYRPGPAAVMG